MSCVFSSPHLDTSHVGVGQLITRVPGLTWMIVAFSGGVRRSEGLLLGHVGSSFASSNFAGSPGVFSCASHMHVPRQRKNHTASTCFLFYSHGKS